MLGGVVRWRLVGRRSRGAAGEVKEGDEGEAGTGRGQRDEVASATMWLREWSGCGCGCGL